MKKGLQAAALFFTLGAASAAQAALVTFEVDPARSVVSLGAIKLNDGDITLAQPGGGSATYGGTFDVDITGNTITFPGGQQTIIANNSAGPLLPGAAPGNYGVVNIEGDTAAIRGFQFNFEGGPLTINPQGQLVDADIPAVPSVLLASYTISTPFGDDYEDKIIFNFGPDSPATLTESNGVRTLEIPISTFITWDNRSSDLQLVGKIVATNGVPIPEPGSVALLALGGATLLARRRKA